MELWLHVPTFTTGIVEGNFIEFKWNGIIEQSYFGLFKEQGEWVYIGKI